MDKFNYLQPSNNDNDLLAAELLLADDFPTYDFSLKQIVADFSPNIATVPHRVESTGTKTKTTLTQRTRRSSRRFKISRDFKRRYRRAGVCCSKQTYMYLLLDKTVDECFFNSWCSSCHLDINLPPPPPQASFMQKLGKRTEMITSHNPCKVM